MDGGGGELAVVGGRVVTPFETISAGVVICRDGRIAYVGPADGAPISRGARVIDAAGGIVGPGLIDLQVNGAGGHDVMAGRARTIAALARWLPAHGVTGFLPTMITAPHEQLDACLNAIGSVARGPLQGARIIGAHLEGPYLSPSPTGRGAHNPAWMRPFVAAEWHDLQRAAGGCIKLLTIAPDSAENRAGIPIARQSGTVVSIGHTDADYETVLAGARAGATLATHTYNAMRGLHHRDPGALGAVLDLDSLTAMVIPDGIHVHPATLRLLLRAKGPDRVVAVSDSIWLAGQPPGEYTWEGRSIVYDGVAPRADGRLAGSGITLRQGLKTLRAAAGLGLAETFRLGALNPARALGLESTHGSLTVGNHADLVVWTPELEARCTIVGGLIAHERAEATAKPARHGAARESA